MNAYQTAIIAHLRWMAARFRRMGVIEHDFVFDRMADRHDVVADKIEQHGDKPGAIILLSTREMDALNDAARLVSNFGLGPIPQEDELIAVPTEDGYARDGLVQL